MAQSLDDYHDRLEAMMAAGDALLAARDPLAAPRIRRRVAEAVMLVASYQIFVHREIFAPMLSSGDPALRTRVVELKVECIALTEDLRFNLNDFLASDAPIDWASLSARVAWFNDRVRSHLARVRALLAAHDAAKPAPRMGPVGVAAFG